MSTHLMEASNQWASRPADERFWTLAELHQHCTETRQNCREIDRGLQTIKAVADGNEVALEGPKGSARLTHWSFSQLCQMADCPADFLRKLPSHKSADLLNFQIGRLDEDKPTNMLMHRNGGLTVRSINSDKYSRIWNCDLTRRLLSLEADHGWQVPPAMPASQDDPRVRRATKDDILANQFKVAGSWGIKEGDLIGPAGLYASDRDMFTFLVNDANRIDDGSEGGLGKGFFLSNSEVGNGTALKMTVFLYRFICGNHIVWNATGIQEVRIIHRGNTDGRLSSEFYAELRKFKDESASTTERKIEAAKRFRLGKDKDEVIDFLFGKRLATKTHLLNAYGAAIKQCADTSYGPNSAYGFSQGLTSYSQTLPYTSARTDLDKVAGHILTMAS